MKQSEGTEGEECWLGHISQGGLPEEVASVRSQEARPRQPGRTPKQKL